VNANEIADELRKGKSLTQLAQETGISRATLSSRYNRAGYSAVRTKLAEIRAAGLPMMAQGLTRKEAAKRLGVSARRLSKAIPEYPVKQRVQFTYDMLQEVNRLLYKAVPVRIIAERLGVTKMTIYNNIRN
jgi:DNA-binding CsgD family transcriptional regulator